MFAVPGWSVSASSLKRQTEADIPKTESQENKAGRKRKRKSANVTAENVSSLWAQRFEGQKPPPPATGANNVKPLKRVTDDKDVKDSSKLASGKAPAPEKPALKEGQAKETPSNGQTKKNKHKKQRDDKTHTNGNTGASAQAAPPPAPPSLPPATKLTPMQQKMRDKLVSARFRHLNETLYTAPSTASLDMFADNPSMFNDYHSGFRRQVSVWPENPVDTFTRSIETRAKVRTDTRRKHGNSFSAANGGAETPDALPRNKAGLCTIADLGCGDAALARKLIDSRAAKRRNLRLLSYDLGQANELVTRADVAKLPLQDGSVDVAIFCLALMGTNWIDFVEEAYRVLRWKGELWVAEIKSRFARKEDKKGQKVVDHSVGKRRKLAAATASAAKKTKEEEEGEETALRTEVDGEEKREDTQVQAFVQVLARRGFVLRKGEQSIDLGNKMFVRMEFVKGAPAAVGKNVKTETTAGGSHGKGPGKRFVEEEEVSAADEATVLKPCLYKIR